MWIFRLMLVESSLVGSVRTEISRMSLYASDKGSSFTINSLIIIGVFTFIAFVQSRLTRGDLSFLMRPMTLKIYFLICRKASVADWLQICMRLCVGCTAFAHVCVRLCEMYLALRSLYGFCARLCTALRNV